MVAKLVKGVYSGKKGFKRITGDVKTSEDHIKAEMNVANIYKGIEDQTFEGFGGAITDSSCSVLEKIDPKIRREILYSYFGENGIGYSLLRVHLDSCDFSERQYEAASDWRDGKDNDFSFKKEHIRQIEIIKEIYDVAGKKLPILLCPWSPPAALKDNGSRIGGKLLKERYKDYADYICFYISMLKKEGLNVKAITIQNEQNAWQIWDSCLYTAKEEKEFIEEAMIPALKKHALNSIEIYLWDHNKERLIERVTSGYDYENSMVKGAAFHWYTGDHFDAVKIAHEMYPSLKLSHTEGCVELTKYGDKSELDNAERYVRDILGDLKCGTNSYYDWNIVLDQEGGPNYVDNFCDAPVIYDLKENRLTYRLSFHYIGMISRYVHPGARRIKTSIYDESLQNVAFKNPDGKVVFCVSNASDKEKEICLRYDGELFEFNMEKHSIAVLVLVV